MLTRTIVFIGAFAAMGGLAYPMHKQLMHGPLWVLHESHRRPRRGIFERNDLFGVFFALLRSSSSTSGLTVTACSSPWGAA